jgi:hypothetical protein
MKRKVKKYAGGNLVDSSGNPVRSGSGEPVRTRFGKDDEDRPTTSGIEDYASMGKRAGASSPFSGPKEYISESVKEESIKEPEMDTEEPRRKFSDYISSKSTSTATEDKPAAKKKVAKKIVSKRASQSFPSRDEGSGSQAFPIRGDDKKVPPLRKIGEAIMGTVANASKPYSSSMYDKMKGRKAGGSIKMASGGKVSSASSRGDGIAQRGKTKGRMC